MGRGYRTREYEAAYAEEKHKLYVRNLEIKNAENDIEIKYLKKQLSQLEQELRNTQKIK